MQATSRDFDAEIMRTDVIDSLVVCKMIHSCEEFRQRHKAGDVAKSWNIPPKHDWHQIVGGTILRGCVGIDNFTQSFEVAAAKSNPVKDLSKSFLIDAWEAATYD